MRRELADLGRTTDLVQRDLGLIGRCPVARRVADHGFPSEPDRHDAERSVILVVADQVADQRSVAFLEHVQRQHKSREQHGPQRKQR